MTTLLVVLTVVEIVLVVAVLAIYLILVTRRLRNISKHLGKIAFGVRAVETHTAAIGPGVLRINETLREIEGVAAGLREKSAR